MSRISVDVSSARIPILQVGYQGENEVTDVLFDISSWITEFGEGVAQLRVKRPGNSEEESYVLSLTITDGIAIYETMRRIQAPVYTICLGSAASMGAFLLAMGEKGHRYCGKYSEVMIHQVLGGFNGQSTDINIHAKHINDLKIKLTYLLAESTQGKTTAETMWNLCERDNFLTPEKALEIGLIDKII